MPRNDLIFGLHAVTGVLKREPGSLRGIWVEPQRRDPRLRDLLERARRHGVTVYLEDRSKLDRMSGGGRHQGVVARRIVSDSVLDEHALPGILAATQEPALVLVLDGVQDPHNLGACLRNADAAGVQVVLVPADRAVGLTPTVRKVACGAAETVPLIQVTNLARSLRYLQEQGLWIIGATGEAETSLYETDLTGPVVVVLGAEGKGLRRLTREICDNLVHIPMMGSVESLNVSVAAGVLLFEAVRQRSTVR